MKTFKLFSLSALLCISVGFGAMAQAGTILITDVAGLPTPRSVLEVKSTTQGMLIPRLNLTSDVAAPATGLMVYQTTEPRGFFYYDGSAWIPFTRPIAGAMDMALGTTPLNGRGYTVVHNGVGSDDVTFDMALEAVPEINVGSGVVAGVPPSFPADLCAQNTAGCTTVQLNGFLMDYQINGSIEFNTGTNNCNVNPGNRTSYDLVDPNWLLAPPTMLPGQNVRLRFSTDNVAHSVSIWADWNANGAFEVGERVYDEDGGPAALLTRNADFTIPGSACAGVTSIRLTVTDGSAPNVLGCGIEPTTLGETEEFEIIIGGGSACVYQEKQVSCNPSAISPLGFRVDCTDLNGAPVDGQYYFKVTDN